MSSRLGKNLRSGHLAEDLGVLVLRRFCAVAQIRQEDDYGIDAVATLLKPDSGLLYAERSFMVQIKSASIKEIVYKNHEVTWLLSQDLPLFFCIVDTNNDSISLYTTNRLYKHLWFFGQIKKITLILGDNPNTFEDIIIPLGENNLENYSPVEEELDLEIYLGQPIFKTTEN